MDQPLFVRILNGIQQLLIDNCNLSQIRQRTTQIASQRPTINKGHHQVEDATSIAKLNQGQDMRMMKPRHSACFTGKAATHIAVSREITENDLNRYASPKGGSLF